MKDFRLLVGLFFKNAFKSIGSNKTSSPGRIVLLVVLIFFGGMGLLSIQSVFISIAPVTARIGRIPNLITILVFFVALITLFIGVPAMISTLYLNKDTEFLLGLPFRTGVIYFAKLAFLYLAELAIVAIFLVPSMLIIGIFGSLGLAYFLFIPLIVIVTPILPLFVASIVSLPLMYIVSFFKARGALSSVLLILVVAIAMSAYYFVVYGSMFNGSDTSGDIGSTIPVEEAMREFYDAIASTLYALPMISSIMYIAVGSSSTIFGNMDVVGSSLVNIGVFVGSIAVIMLVMYGIASLVYRQGIRSQLEGNKRLVQGSKDTQSTVIRALASKEYKELIRTPAFAMQCLTSMVVIPVFAVFIGLGMGRVGSSIEIDTEFRFAADIVEAIRFVAPLTVALFMSGSFTAASGSIFSREGDKFYYLKIFPVDMMTQVRAKLRVCYTMSAISIAIVNIVFAVANKDILTGILSLPIMLMIVRANNLFAASFDVSHPKLVWTNPNEAVKRSNNVGMAAGAIFGMAIGVSALLSGWAVVSVLLGASLAIVKLVVFVLMYGLGTLYLWLTSKRLSYRVSVCLDSIEV